MNRAALTMYGLVEQNAIGKPLSLLISSPEAAEKIIRQLMAAVKALATGGKDDAHSQSSGTRTTVFPPEESEAHRGNQGHIFFTSLFLTIVAETKGAKGSKPLCVLSIRDITDDRHKSQLLEEEKARSDQLLTNILPRSIATRLSNGDRNIADGYENVSVLFFDLVGFTSMSSKMPPQELVATLNDVFSGFDDIILQNGCEKIKTIGDAIMVASGLPEPRPDHGRALVQTGLDFIEHLKSVNQRRGLSLNCRIGINSGPVVAGVIGKMKFAYDLWSDTVNVASRMESTSLSGRIQVSRSAYELTYKFFDYEERPAVEVKGKGLMQCYLVIGPKQQSQ
jgi:class 3 adenylate cyclase